MNHAALTLLIAGLLPIICAGIAKWGAKRYDNHNPREWMANLDGRRARADAAQKNSFEAFPFFAVGMILALMSDAEDVDIAFWGWMFVLMRVVYIYCYITDKATLRSIFWTLGLAVVIRLFALAI